MTPVVDDRGGLGVRVMQLFNRYFYFQLNSIFRLRALNPTAKAMVGKGEGSSKHVVRNLTSSDVLVVSTAWLTANLFHLVLYCCTL